MGLEQIGLEAILDDKNFQVGLKRYQSGVGDMTKSTEQGANTLSKLAGIAGGVLTVGVGIAAGAAAGLGAALLDCTKGAIEAEKIQAALNAVLQSTGGAAGMTADAVNDLAGSLQNVTPFEDDMIVQGENLLLTFTNIGKDVFPMATEAMLNMSVALGQDMKGSAIQLGKALNDPITGASALRRVGVALTDAQEEQIKTFMKSGDVLSAQNVILNELQKEFGGAARAAGQTFGGQMTILNNQVGAIKDNIGTALLPTLTKLATSLSETLARPDVQAALSNLAKGIGELAEKAAGFIGNLSSMDVSKIGIPQEALKAITAVTDAMQKMAAEVAPMWAEAWKNINDAMAEMGISWGDVFSTTLKVIAGLIVALIGVLVGLTKAVSTMVLSVTKTMNDFSKNFKSIIEGVAKVFANWISAWKKIFAGDFAGALKDAGGVLGGFLQVVTGCFKQMWLVIDGTLGTIINTVSAFVTGVLDFFKKLAKDLVGGSIIPDMMADMNDVIQNTLNAIRNFISNILDTIAGIFRAGFQGFVNITEAAWDTIQAVTTSVWNDVRNTITTILNAISSVVSTVTDGIRTTITSAWNTVSSITTTVWTAIRTTIDNALSAMQSAVTSGMNAISSTVTTIWNAVSSITSTVWAAIRSTIDGALAAMQAAITTGMNAINSTMTTIWNGIGSITTTAWTAIRTTIDTTLAAIQTAVSTGLNAVQSTMSSIWTTLQNITTTTWAAISSTIGSWVDTIGARVNTGFQAVQNTVSNAWTSIRDGVAGAWTLITNAISGAIGAIVSNNGVVAAIATVVGIGNSIATTVKNGIDNLWYTVTNFMSGAISALTGNLDIWYAIGQITSIGSGIVNSIKNGISDLWTHWENGVGVFLGGLISKLGYSGFASTIIENIKTSITSAWAAFVEWLVSQFNIRWPWETGIESIAGSAARGGTASSASTASYAITNTRTTQNNYNLNVVTTTPQERIVSDFYMMQTMGAVG